MTIFILILAAVVLIGLVFGAAAWFLFRQRGSSESKGSPEDTVQGKPLSFRWKLIIVPIVVFALSAIVSVVFYPLLPDIVGYHFTSDGTPDRWLTREMAMVVTVVPQLLLALLAGGITRGITALGILSSQTTGIGIKAERLLFFTGNIAVIPQIVLAFVILDIFVYNAFQIRILPTWAFILLLVLSTVALGAFLILTILKGRRQLKQHTGE